MKIEGVVENIDVNISRGISDFLKGIKPVRWQLFIDAFLEKESSEKFTASKGFKSLEIFLNELCGRGFEIDASGIRIGNNYLYYMVNKNLLMSKIMRNICHYLDIEAEDRDIEDCSFNDFLESLYGIQDGPDVVVQFNVMDFLMDREVNPDFFFPDDIVEWYVKMFTERANMKK